jgi:ATP-dependent protease ClpP protease subunit
LLVPSNLYRPDPNRAIHIDGQLDDKLLSRLSPQILKLLAQNRKPITVYILDSPGGSTATARGILSMLRASDQDASPACRLITVVTSKAQSAAADLLSSGDYAIAYPGCSLLYHGVRTPGLIPALQPLTAERTSLLAHLLRLTNDAYAMELVKRAEGRFMFRFIMMRPEMRKIQDANPKKPKSDLECFIELTSPKLSESARKIFKKAQERYARYEPLLAEFTIKSKFGKRGKIAREEARQIKAIVDFEVADNKANPSWTFKDGGLSRLVEDFFLVAEYLESQQNERLKLWCKTLSRFALSKNELDEIERIPDEKGKNEALLAKVQPPVQPVWSFFVALCHALQEDENELSSTDAYWLGLIDEVIGEGGLATSRWFEEWQPDPQPPAPQVSQSAEA